MQNCKRMLLNFLAIILCCEFAVAKTNINDWNNVRILEPGTTILVKMKQGDKYEGTLDVTSASSLSIVVKVPHAMQRTIDLRMDEIKEVRAKLSRGASTAIGAGIGLGIGIGLGAIADSRDKYREDPGLGKVALGLVGALVGSAFGRGFGFGSRKIYEAP